MYLVSDDAMRTNKFCCKCKNIIKTLTLAMLQSAGHERVKENKFKFLNYRKSIVFLFFLNLSFSHTMNV